MPRLPGGCKAVAIHTPGGQLPVAFTSAVYTVVDGRGVSETGTRHRLSAALHRQPTVSPRKKEKKNDFTLGD